jgi:hypothetical protein
MRQAISRRSAPVFARSTRGHLLVDDLESLESHPHEAKIANWRATSKEGVAQDSL